MGDYANKPRKIVVAEQTFRWKATIEYGDIGGSFSSVISFRAWREQGRGVTLKAYLVTPRPKPGELGIFLIKFMPKDAAILIKAGLENGWRPGGSGTYFWLKKTHNAKVEDLVVIDLEV